LAGPLLPHKRKEEFSVICESASSTSSPATITDRGRKTKGIEGRCGGNCREMRHAPGPRNGFNIIRAKMT